MLSVLGPIQKRGVGAVRFRPDMKSGGGGGGGGAVCFRSDTKSGGGGACRTMIYILVCARARDSA